MVKVRSDDGTQGSGGRTHLQRWTREPTFAISKRPATPTACSAVSQSHSQNKGIIELFLTLELVQKIWHWKSIISRIHKTMFD